MFYFLNPVNTKKKCFAGRVRRNAERKLEFFWDGKNPLRKTAKEKFEDNMDAIRILQKKDMEQARAELERPFGKEEELKEKQARLQELNILLDLDDRKAA